MQEKPTHTYYTLSCASQPEQQQKIFCKKYSTVKNECQNHIKLNKKKADVMNNQNKKSFGSHFPQKCQAGYLNSCTEKLLEKE